MKGKRAPVFVTRSPVACVVGVQLPVFLANAVYYSCSGECSDLHDGEVGTCDVDRDLECEARSDGVDVAGRSRTGLLEMPCACTRAGHDSDRRQKTIFFMPAVERTPGPLPRHKRALADGGACGDPALSLAALSSSPSIASLQLVGRSFGTPHAYKWHTKCLLQPAAVASGERNCVCGGLNLD